MEKVGPLTREELIQLWKSVTDSEYHNPLIDKSDSLIELIEQAAEQFAAVSAAIDRNTQSMYILPWSGQSNPSASGEAYSRTVLTVTRTGDCAVPIYFTAGEIVIQHRLNDYGPTGPIDVTTNRTYVVEQSNVLGVGEAGPIQLAVVATSPGVAFDYPTPGTLTKILQPGVGFSNSGASVQNNPGKTHRVIAKITPDVPIVDHIGQYLLFTAGANQGRYCRIVGVENADIVAEHGGVFNVAAEMIARTSSLVGVFHVGELVTQLASNSTGLVLSYANARIVILRTSGNFVTGSVQGELGATANLDAIEQSALLNEESGTASWRVVDWVNDLGIVVTNLEQPTGGRYGFLDELGNERGLPRSLNETDDEYSRRISTPADVVTPAAVIRAGNKIVAPLGEQICLREVGQASFPGMFYDAAPSTMPFAYDLDYVPLSVVNGTGFMHGERVVATRSDGLISSAHLIMTSGVVSGVASFDGADFQVGTILQGTVSKRIEIITSVGTNYGFMYRFYTYLDDRSFRGFFLVGVPRIRLDDFGIFYDSGYNNAYDATPIENFYDGVATGTNSLYSRIYSAVNGVRPAGVPFDLYIEDYGCV